jgi:hypothetical protein
LGIFQGKVQNELTAMGSMFERYIPTLGFLTNVTALCWTMNNPDALDFSLIQMWRKSKASAGRLGLFTVEVLLPLLPMPPSS